MSYEPTNWKTGDVVTAAKLNKLESGVAGAGIFWVTATEDSETGTITLNKSYNEIKAAIRAGQMPVLLEDESDEIEDSVNLLWLSGYASAEAEYCVQFDYAYLASDPDEPLTYSNSGGGGNIT